MGMGLELDVKKVGMQDLKLKEKGSLQFHEDSCMPQESTLVFIMKITGTH